MLISELKLTELLFVEFEKKMLSGKLSSDVLELFSLLWKQCLLSANTTNFVDTIDYDFENGAIRYADIVLNEFDCYFERCVARQSPLERTLFCIGNYRGRRTIERAQEFLSTLFFKYWSSDVSRI
jgi:hypothetical protein